MKVSLAISEYEHVRDLVSGAIRPAGVALSVCHPSLEEMFRRFPTCEAWDVSEMSLGFYCSMRASGDDRLTAIPVFPSRMFRQSAIYVVKGGRIRTPGDLKGARIGLPSWNQTAMIYVRGWLSEEIGLDLREIRWSLGGVDQPRGSTDTPVPKSFKVREEGEKSLASMLVDGDIDALISSHPPEGFAGGHGQVVRLLEDSVDAERAYFGSTGIFPIMHIVALKASLVDSAPSLVGSLYSAFCAARDNAVHRLRNVSQSLFPVPWLADHVEAQGNFLFGAQEYWPYGIEPNRATLEAFLRYSFDQDVCSRLLSISEIFCSTEN